MTTEEFQAQYGEDFARILNSPAFSAGMIHLTIAVTNRVKNLSDEEIQRNSVTILSDLRGRLRHESELIALAIPPEPSIAGDIREEYVDAINEQFAEHQRNNPATTV